jgi:succinate dehydrogenase / fumarate reductase cytochrome b subunit
MTTATQPPYPPKPGSTMSRINNYDFLLRRLHSLSGILPIGVFIIGHLFTNAQMAWPDGGEIFQHEVDFIHSIPGLLIIEITLWLSIAFHAIVGIWITMTGRSNTSKYLYGGNIRYTLQRWTGIIAIIFIFLHVATLRWRWPIWDWFTPFYAYHELDSDVVAQLGHEYDAAGKIPMSMPLTAYALQISWLVVVLYFLGALASVYHWCNGLWTAAITWGLTISAASMKRWGYVCAGLFVALTAFFILAIYGALAYDIGQDTTDAQLAAFLDIVPEPKIEIDTSGRTSK